MTLTADQRKAVEAGQKVALNIDGIECVLLRADLFAKVEAAVVDGLTHEELDAMLAISADGSDWMDPAMDIYDEYDKHR